MKVALVALGSLLVPSLASGFSAIHVDYLAQGTVTRVDLSTYRIEIRGEGSLVSRGGNPEYVEVERDGVVYEQPLWFYPLDTGLVIDLPGPVENLTFLGTGGTFSGQAWASAQFNGFPGIAFDFRPMESARMLLLPYRGDTQWLSEYVDPLPPHVPYHDNIESWGNGYAGHLLAQLPETIGSTVSLAVTPEPASFLSLGLGILLLSGGLRNRRWRGWRGERRRRKMERLAPKAGFGR